MLKTEELKLVSEWDKTFPKSEKVDHEKVIFVNRYGSTLAADLYKPKNAFGKYPAIAVSGPFGAVKEQCSGLYAQTMAEKGYRKIKRDDSKPVLNRLFSRNMCLWDFLYSFKKISGQFHFLLMDSRNACFFQISQGSVKSDDTRKIHGTAFVLVREIVRHKE